VCGVRQIFGKCPQPIIAIIGNNIKHLICLKKKRKKKTANRIDVQCVGFVALVPIIIFFIGVETYYDRRRSKMRSKRINSKY